MINAKQGLHRGFAGITRGQTDLPCTNKVLRAMCARVYLAGPVLAILCPSELDELVGDDAFVGVGEVARPESACAAQHTIVR
jgi:hypothetical protein